MKRIARLAVSLNALLMGLLSNGAVVHTVQAQASRDETEWAAAKADGSRRAYERYLQRNPIGRHAGEAFITISRMSVDPDWSAAAAGAAATRTLVAGSADVY